MLNALYHPPHTHRNTHRTTGFGWTFLLAIGHLSPVDGLVLAASTGRMTTRVTKKCPLICYALHMTVTHIVEAAATRGTVGSLVVVDSVVLITYSPCCFWFPIFSWHRTPRLQSSVSGRLAKPPLPVCVAQSLDNRRLARFSRPTLEWRVCRSSPLLAQCPLQRWHSPCSFLGRT